METNVQNLFKGYLSNQFYDEMFEQDGTIKELWKPFYEHYSNLGIDELKQRQDEIDWILAENGITYNIFNDPSGLNRPWKLNTVPFIMSANEWKTVEKGLQQRATLLDLIAKDIYGEQKLITNGIIPFEVIYSHRGFLRPCHDIELNTDKFLSFYAADLSRGPNGKMWVVHDRTNNPAGMGYALENRTVSSHVFNNFYTKSNFKPLDPFFNSFNEMLLEASPKNITNPNIVILTSGPHSETYFEHAYLSSHFGYPMLKGQDLIVRNGAVWMKSLKELKKIDVIFNRVNDFDLDPLELRENSYLGVAGLLNVVRNKKVSIINPIGTSVIENSGLIPFMPAIAQYFLKENLILPQIATWWCGQEKELQHVLTNITNLVIKRIDRSNRESIIFGDYLNADELEKLKDKIKANPYLYVAQEKIKFSTVPNFSKNHLEPRKMVCRSFIIAAKDNYCVMPGGLTRVASAKENIRVSNQRGGTSMDFCVLEDNQVTHNQKPKYRGNLAPKLSGLDNLPSQTAENLYWAGRYISRTLITARHLRMVIKQLSAFKNTDNNNTSQKIEILLESVINLTEVDFKYKTETNDFNLPQIQNELSSLILDKSKSGSIAQTISYFSNAYFSIRNLWSADMWRVFDSITNLFTNAAESTTEKYNSYKKLIKLLNQLITRLIAFMGLIEESILVNQGLLLYFIGLNIENSMLYVKNSKSILTEVTSEEYLQYEILEALLQSHESLNIYRYSYQSYINIESVVSLLLLEGEYARSLTYLIRYIQKDVKKLPHSNSEKDMLAYDIAINKAFLLLVNGNAKNLSLINETTNEREKLMLFLDQLLALLKKTAKSITDTYFNHVNKQNQLTTQNFS